MDIYSFEARQACHYCQQGPSRTTMAMNCFALSKKKQCFLLFEAAVGGALPLIKNFQYLFGGENFQAIYGILNSTSNFILSRMMEGIPFHEA